MLPSKSRPTASVDERTKGTGKYVFSYVVGLLTLKVAAGRRCQYSMYRRAAGRFVNAAVASLLGEEQDSSRILRRPKVGCGQPMYPMSGTSCASSGSAGRASHQALLSERSNDVAGVRRQPASIPSVLLAGRYSEISRFWGLE